jgi:uncharacterized protein YutE (UPF0331/DUF86 family)
LDSRIAAWDTFERAMEYLESELARVQKIKETRKLTEEKLRYGLETQMEMMNSMHKMIRRQFGSRRGGTDEE